MENLPDREAYELQISLLKEQIEKIKRDTNYRTTLTNRLKIVRASLELAYATPDQYTNKIDATIDYLESLNNL